MLKSSVYLRTVSIITLCVFMFQLLLVFPVKTVLANETTATQISGNIVNDTKWTKENSPYILLEDVQINAGATLTIEPGVEVRGNGYSIVNYGNFVAVGTEEEPIVFDTLHLLGNTSEQGFSYILEHVKMNGGRLLPQTDASNGKIVIRYSEFRDLMELTNIYLPTEATISFNKFIRTGPISIASNVDVNILHNLFLNTNSYFNIKGVIQSWGNYNGSKVYVNYNSFYVEGTVLESKFNGSIDGRYNYWNTTDTGEIEGKIFDRNDDSSIQNEISYEPILEQPHQDTPTIKVTGVSLDKETVVLGLNETYQLIATVYPEEAVDKRIVWSTSDPDIVLVDETGKIKAVGMGEANITATTVDGGFTAVCHVIVEGVRVSGVSIEDKSSRIVQTFGGSEEDRFYAIAVTKDGGYIAVGYSKSVNKDMTDLNKGNEDAVIVEYDFTGGIEWKKSFGGSSRDYFNAVALTGDGGYIAVGYSDSTDGDLSGLNKGSYDAIIAKYDASGEIEWRKSFGGSSSDYFNAVVATQDGGCIAVVYSKSTDLDMAGLSKGYEDAIIVKYDASGEIEWKRSFGGNGGDYFNAVAVTDDGGYIAAGYSNSLDGDMAGLKKGSRDAIIVKYDVLGNIEWKRSFGGSDWERFTSIAATKDGGYIATGYSYSSDGDMAGLNKGSRDAIIVKYDALGNIEWKRSFGGSDWDYFTSVAITKDEGYVAVGYSYSTGGDMAGLNKGLYDAIIVKYDASGEIEWKRSFGGSTSDYFTSETTTEDEGYIAAGYSNSSDGDMAGLNKGIIFDDAIIIKYYHYKKVVKIGNEISLSAVIDPADAADKRVKWLSLDDNIVTVNQYGMVKALGVGNTKVVVETLDGGFRDECEIVVKPIYISEIKMNIFGMNVFGGSRD